MEQLTTQSYQYSSLPTQTCIRVMRLETHDAAHAAEPGFMPSFSLHTFELSDAPPFDALSYTWGDPRCPLVDHPLTVDYYGPTHPTLCDGHIFPARKNLHDALKRLGQSPVFETLNRVRAKYLWVDAICINQDDIQERNAQVLQMGDLYRRAASVIAWLGEEDELITQQSLGILHQLSLFGFIPRSWGEVRQIREDICSWITPQDFHDDEGYREKLGAERPGVREWLAFASFLQLSFFRRAWIVQEVTLAKDITMVWGERVFDFDDVARTAWFLAATGWAEFLLPGYFKRYLIGTSAGPFSKLVQSKKSPLLSLLPLVQTRCQANYTTPIFQSMPDLLRVHRPCEATDPRDRVFAFLGIANKRFGYFTDSEKAIFFMPDYNRPLVNLYTVITRLFVMESGNLRTLINRGSRVLVKSSLAETLPSWVPDYTVAVIPDPLHVGGTWNWSANGSHVWRPDHLPIDELFLGVQGVEIGEISETSIPYAGPEAGISIHQRWASMAPLLQGLRQFYNPMPQQNADNESPASQPQTRIEAFCRTLVADIFNNTHPAALHAIAPQFLGELAYIVALGIAEYDHLPTNSSPFGQHILAISQLPNEPYIVPWLSLLDAEPETSPFSSACFAERLNAFYALLESRAANTNEDLSVVLSGGSDLCADFRRGAQDQERVLLKTRQGFLGMGPLETEVGDAVWVLAGSKTPVVLRRGLQGRWRLVGEAYVHGIMHGEAIGWGNPLKDLMLE